MAHKTINGTAYHAATPCGVVRVLERARADRSIRVRIYYGDPDTGRDCQQTNDTTGFIGRSPGDIRVPLLIPRLDSVGGSAIHTQYIVRIDTKAANSREYITAWKHPKYHT